MGPENGRFARPGSLSMSAGLGQQQQQEAADVEPADLARSKALVDEIGRDRTVGDQGSLRLVRDLVQGARQSAVGELDDNASIAPSWAESSDVARAPSDSSRGFGA